MNTPDFWKKRNFFTFALNFFSIIYFLGMRIRSLLYAGKKPFECKLPVICIGNVTVGGAGKTPVAMAISKLLKKHGKDPVFLSKGYKGILQGPIKVNPEKHKAFEVGDEPLLLAQTSRCWVSKDRPSGLKAVETTGAKAVVMDDGMQNLSIKKDVTFAVVDGSYGFGNGFVLPAGPLRDRLQQALTSADAVIVIGRDRSNVRQFLGSYNIIQARIKILNKIKDKNKKFIAFAGIAIPEKFFRTLEKEGIKISRALAFPDHWSYSEKELDKIIEIAKEEEAGIITTEKDMVKIPKKYRSKMTALKIEVTFDNPEEVINVLKKRTSLWPRKFAT